MNLKVTRFEVLAIILALLLCLVAWAQPSPPIPPSVPAPVPTNGSVALAWDPSPDSGVAAYRIHWGTNANRFVSVTNFGLALTGWVQNLRVGQTYYFAATAVGTNQLESDFTTNQVAYTVPTPEQAPAVPGSVGIKQKQIITETIYGKDNLSGAWIRIGEQSFIIDSKKPVLLLRSSLAITNFPAVEYP